MAETTPERPGRETLMARHAEARHRRDRAPLDSEAFQKAAEDVARIEVAIAKMEEPERPAPVTAAAIPK